MSDWKPSHGDVVLWLGEQWTIHRIYAHAIMMHGHGAEVKVDPADVEPVAVAHWVPSRHLVPINSWSELR